MVYVHPRGKHSQYTARKLNPHPIYTYDAKTPSATLYR
jgi:hypothetical protein